jgi:transcription elongation factor GreA
MTASGYDRLQEELKRLKFEERPQVIRALETARAHGDLSENAEYEAAKERQSFVEGRIGEIEDKTRRAEVIDVARLTGDAVKFGATIQLVDEATDEESIYQIVGADESDIKAGLLSVDAPLARALITKTVGDTVEVSTPSGFRSYEILKVQYR